MNPALRELKLLKDKLKYAIRRRVGEDYMVFYRLPPKDSSIPAGHVAVSIWNYKETCVLVEEKELVDDESQPFAKFRDIGSIDVEQFEQLMENLRNLEDEFGPRSNEYKHAFSTLTKYLR